MGLAFDQEYSSAIYEENGKYKYTDPIIGNGDEVIVPSSPVGKKLRVYNYSTGKTTNLNDKMPKY